MTRSFAKRTAYCAAFVCVAMLLSYLEALLPILPFPGFKPGLANLAVMVAYFWLGLPSAAAVSLCRIALSALLFGSPVSLLFSICGGALSLCALLLHRLWLKHAIGAIGLGVISAALHCVGQTLAASILYGAALLFTYLPWLLILSIFTGALSGVLLHTALRKLPTNL